jgi:hypothetical protein
MKLLGIIGTQEIIILITVLPVFLLLLLIPYITYKWGLRRGRMQGREERAKRSI